jgi:hypothetical protein
MIQIWASLAMMLQPMLARPFPVQFARPLVGRSVQVSIDGDRARTSFAGKLGFKDRSSSWTSVCADVRAPMVAGRLFRVKAFDSRLIGGNVSLAGNIVAKYFNAARSADECAALQLAVWEAREDGGEHADFANGRFRARATQSVIQLANQAYEAASEPGMALFLQSGEGGQDQLTPPIN